MKKSFAASLLVSSVLCAGHTVKETGSLSDKTPPSAKAEVKSSQKAPPGSFAEMLKNGKFSAKLKLFYMIRTFDDIKPATEALNGGGILKYESGTFHGFTFAFAYYGSYRMAGLYSRSKGIGTSLLQHNGDDIQFLGEANLQYAIDKTTLKAGRQRLATPLIRDNEQRLLPTVYEAAIVRNQDISNTTVEAGYLKSYSGFGSRFSGFTAQDVLWGSDGLGYIYVKNNSIKNLVLRGQYIKAISNSDNHGKTIAIRDYKYIDLKYRFAIGTNSYLKAQLGGNRYNSAPNSVMAGVKIGTTLFDLADVALLYDNISGNIFEAVNAAPIYSDFQQGYGLYEPSSAFGGQIIVKPVEDLRIKMGYAHVSSHTKRLVDDFSEYILDVKYKINHRSKCRIRGSFKDQSDASEGLLPGHKGGREDRSDIRVIYSITF